VFCNQCGFGNPPGSSFCAKCGAKLVATQAPAMPSAPPAKKGIPAIAWVAGGLMLALVLLSVLRGNPKSSADRERPVDTPAKPVDGTAQALETLKELEREACEKEEGQTAYWTERHNLAKDELEKRKYEQSATDWKTKLDDCHHRCELVMAHQAEPDEQIATALRAIEDRKRRAEESWADRHRASEAIEAPPPPPNSVLKFRAALLQKGAWGTLVLDASETNGDLFLAVGPQFLAMKKSLRLEAAKSLASIWVQSCGHSSAIHLATPSGTFVGGGTVDFMSVDDD